MSEDEDPRDRIQEIFESLAGRWVLFGALLALVGFFIYLAIVG